MALADLLHAIEADAEAERARADRETSAEAEAILVRAGHEAETLERELVASSESAAREETERILASARADAAGSLRSAREEAFNTLLADLHARLGTLRESDAYPMLFEALLTESRTALPAACVLRVDPRDLALAAPLAGDLQVQATLDTWGGVELASNDDRILRNTLEERLANAEPVLRLRLAHRLSRTLTDGS